MSHGVDLLFFNAADPTLFDTLFEVLCMWTFIISLSFGKGGVKEF